MLSEGELEKIADTWKEQKYRKIKVKKWLPSLPLHYRYDLLIACSCKHFWGEPGVFGGGEPGVFGGGGGELECLEGGGGGGGTWSIWRGGES